MYISFLKHSTDHRITDFRLLVGRKFICPPHQDCMQAQIVSPYCKVYVWGANYHGTAEELPRDRSFCIFEEFPRDTFTQKESKNGFRMSMLLYSKRHTILTVVNTEGRLKGKCRWEDKGESLPELQGKIRFGDKTPWGTCLHHKIPSHQQSRIP